MRAVFSNEALTEKTSLCKAREIEFAVGKPWHGMVQGKQEKGDSRVSPLHSSYVKLRGDTRALFVALLALGSRRRVVVCNLTCCRPAAFAQIVVQQNRFGNFTHRFTALSTLALHRLVGSLLVESKVAL